MTCEISIMNRQAIVLAADSATTVSYWSEVDREWKERYFKGANKIFQLSALHPVGIMIYGAASLHDVPWELVVKDFRAELGEKSFTTVEGYATEFFSFIRAHQHLFPTDYRDKIFCDEVERVAFTFLMMGRDDDTVQAAGTDATAKTAAYRTLYQRIAADVDALPVAPPFDATDLEGALGKYRPGVEKVVREASAAFDDAPNINVEQLAELSIRRLLKAPTALMQPTGVVIAGYGDHDYFPKYHEYQCHGLLLGKFLQKSIDSRSVGLDRPAEIKAFATTDMVNTFQIGFSPDTFTTVRDELNKTLHAFADALKQELGHADEIPNLEERIATSVKGYMDDWMSTARRAHVWPLLRVIGSLPVDEMAVLAETLIELQSLKEKVTKPTESVGGPIDVAVISKADGFIWIKRKHYFDPQLNPRFFARQSLKRD